MITDLRLQHFRSYDDDSFEFQPGVNIIVGPNASGKTNLLEAILVLAAGSSYRVSDAELVQRDQPWARLDSHDSNDHDRTMKIVLDPRPTKTFEFGGKVIRRLSLKDKLPVVLFEPNHLQLLAGSPEQRRQYLDDLLEQTEAGYGQLRREYKRILAQRNSLLKQPALMAHGQLFAWNIRLSEAAGHIVRARSRLTAALNDHLSSLYSDLSHSSTHVQLAYACRFTPDNYQTQLLKKLESDLVLDQARGFTGSGPHREDLLVTFDNQPAALSASRGESRTAVLALKILELDMLRAARDISPILLLDDVFSELDGARRRALTSYLRDYQTFITTTDADVVIQNFTETCHVIALGG
ncbi:MAG: DNA replication and repair protein RecF [Patescibacteria group bacterium]|nr:DNA replication and repair protein RecF [Patescibacteria group bacterium]